MAGAAPPPYPEVLPADDLLEAAPGRGFQLARVTVTDREFEGARFEVRLVGLGKVPETPVRDESRWDEAVWASAGSFLDKILVIISNGSFPQSRDSLPPGQRSQLRDAMILEAHIREGRDIFVSNDRSAFVRNGRREQLEARNEQRARLDGPAPLLARPPRTPRQESEMSMTALDDQLLKAASAGDLGGVSQALEQGANVNTKDEYNNTSLNWAALVGSAEVVKRLLEAGADLENQGSGGGMTPLANAVSRGHSDVAQILLDHGARVTDDLLSILQTKVNIFEENREAGMVTEEGVAHWKRVLDLFIAQRMEQDLPDVVPHLSSTDPAERRGAATRVAEAAQRGLDVTAAASPLPALLSDADPDTRGQAGRALTYHLARAGDWPGVTEILASTDVRLRLAASEALIRAEPADASLVQPLGVLLHDGDAEVRKTAAIAVATLPRKGIDAMSLLARMIELLADSDAAVRRSAAFAFSLWSKRGLRDYCSPALPALRRVAERDDNEAVRHFAAQVVAAAEAAP